VLFQRRQHHLRRLLDQGLVHAFDFRRWDNYRDVAVAFDAKRLALREFSRHGFTALSEPSGVSRRLKSNTISLSSCPRIAPWATKKRSRKNGTAFPLPVLHSALWHKALDPIIRMVLEPLLGIRGILLDIVFELWRRPAVFGR